MNPVPKESRNLGLQARQVRLDRLVLLVLQEHQVKMESPASLVSKDCRDRQENLV